jgi:hypothetical protein
MGRIARDWEPWVALARSIVLDDNQRERVLDFKEQVAKEEPAVRHLYIMALTVGQLLFERSVEGRGLNELYPLPMCLLIEGYCKNCLFLNNRKELVTCRFLADPGKNFKVGIKMYNSMVQGLHRKEKRRLFGDRI